MKYGFFTERYGYGLFKETENNIIVEFVPSGDTLIEIMVIDKPKKRLDTSYVRKRVKRFIKINDLCDDRSRSRRDELYNRFDEFSLSKGFWEFQ